MIKTPKINSILEINPDAIFIAEALDYERRKKSGGVTIAWNTCFA